MKSIYLLCNISIRNQVQDLDMNESRLIRKLLNVVICTLLVDQIKKLDYYPTFKVILFIIPCFGKPCEVRNTYYSSR
uniref:Uncharacterized protein n=1 Tax=Schistosoma curassoni TaxID=6186 RepID=A0A183KPG4_9TREM